MPFAPPAPPGVQAMTPPSTPPSDGEEEDPATPQDTLELILHTLLPLLLLSPVPSPFSFPGKWAHLRSKLSLLQSSLLDASRHPDWPSHPLFPDLLPSILRTLRSLRPLSRRCLHPSPPGGKLLLQSDLDIASSSLSLHLHDLNLLLRSGLLLPSSSHAIVLPQPSSSSSKDDLSLFVRDLFARLLIGSLDLKKKALDSLLRLFSDPPADLAARAKLAALVAQEGDVACLIHLLDPSNHSLIREHAAAAVAALAAASDASRRAVFEEGALGPLLRLLESGSAPAREKAAAAVEAITADHGNAWAVPAYGGVPVLIEACRPGAGGLPATQAKASGALRNVAAAVADARDVMVEEGAVAVLVGILDCGGTSDEARRNAVHCLWILASAGEDFRSRILQEGALPKLVSLFREPSPSDPELPEHVLRALYALSTSQPAAKLLSGSPAFFSQLSELISRGGTVMQQISASLLCNLSPGEDAKRAMAGSMPALVKMMELPKPAGVQEMAAMALVLLLTVRSNRKDLTRDEKSMMRLVQMLDPRSGEGLNKRFPVSVISALASGGGGGTGGGGCRKRIVAAGACQQLQKLADFDVPGAKKALQRITGGRLKNLLSSISWRE